MRRPVRRPAVSVYSGAGWRWGILFRLFCGVHEPGLRVCHGARHTNPSWRLLARGSAGDWPQDPHEYWAF